MKRTITKFVYLMYVCVCVCAAECLRECVCRCVTKIKGDGVGNEIQSSVHFL